MALAARKLSDQEALTALVPAPAGAPLQAATAAFEPQGWASSPARDLQEQLSLAFTEPADVPADEKWSARRSLVFMVGASALLWGAIIGGVALLLG